MKLSRIFILLLAAGGGAAYYKISHTLMDEDNSSIPGHNVYASLTGSGSLMQTWRSGTQARNVAMSGNGAPPSNFNNSLATNYAGKSHTKTINEPVKNAGPPDDLALLEAAAKGDEAAVEKRIGAHVKIDSRDNERRTPLMYAAWSGYGDICSRLLAAGANPGFEDRAGNNALDYAASRGLVDMVNFLLARIHASDDKHYVEYAQVVQAVYASDLAKLPTGNGALASVNRLNPLGQAPLQLAAGNGSTALMGALLARGAQVNLGDANRQTALHWAAWNNQLEAAQLLVDKGADIAATDLAGNTPLMLAAQNGHAETAQYLLKKGADRYAANKDGKTAALLAEDHGHKDVAALLK